MHEYPRFIDESSTRLDRIPICYPTLHFPDNNIQFFETSVTSYRILEEGSSTIEKKKNDQKKKRSLPIHGNWRVSLIFSMELVLVAQRAVGENCNVARI